MAAQGQKEDCVKMGPEAEEQVTCSEVKNDYVEESSRNNSLDIIEKLGFLQSMSTDEKIKQFQMFLTTALINDLVRQLSEVQYLLLLHYFVMALCSRGQAQDLFEAEKHIMAIRKMTKETPECQSFLYVAYHMLGCLYFKQNRFDEAMKWFQNSKQEFEDNPPTIEWADLVLKSEEIEPKHFPIKINEYIEMCKRAPKPVAICQDSNCQGYYKREIYPTDPDYKGYVELSCDSYCLISYHLTCWKRLKDSPYHGKSNQDFCSMKCLNSDCKGLIIKCVIHNASGIAQTEFEIKNSDLSSRISTIKSEQKAVNTLEGLSKRNEQNECEKERKEKETDLLTDKCRLYREIILKRKLIENAIVETGKVTELIISWDLKNIFMEKSSEITAEMILNHVLRWNCNFKIRQFLMMLKDEDLSNHPELKKWITYILELGDQCSLCFLYSYKKVIIPILCDMENLLNFAQKLLSRKALSKEEVKMLALTPSEQRPDVLMEQVTSHKDVWQMGELVFALAEEQDRLPKLKPLFDEFNREFEKFNKGHVPNFGTILSADPLSQNMDYSLFYRLLHLLIIKGTEVLLRIFDRAVPPQILKRELLKNKRILEPYHKGSSRSALNSGEWSLLYPSNNEQPNSKKFDITLLASLIRHLKILPAPRGGWDAEPLPNDQSKSAAVLRLSNLRNQLLFETLNTGIKEPDFTIEWDKITEVLVSLGADCKLLKQLKNCPVENLWEDHHQLASYLGKPVADVMQMLLSLFQPETSVQTKREISTNTTGLPALTAPQETKQQTMEPTDLKSDDDSPVLKAKAKSKKKKKKSRSKKAQTNEDNRNITRDGLIHQCETLSIPVQENQLDDGRSNKQVADSSCDVSTFSADVAVSSRLVLGTVHNNNNAGPFLTSHEVNKLDDLPDQTYESDGELDETKNTLIDEGSTGSSVCTSSDLCSSSSVDDRTINVQEHLWQNAKEKSEMRRKLLALQNENQALVRNLDQLITKLQEEQQQRTHAENQYSRLQEHYQLEISRVNQQLQSKDEEIKKIATQFANERLLWNKDKAKLEDVTAKNIAKLVEATKRAIAAEILFLECRRDNGLFQLQQAEQDCSIRLRTAEENLTENPESADLLATVDGWQAIVADIRNKIDFTKNQFDEQINLVKSGTKLNVLPKIKIPPPPPHPDAVMKHFLEQHLQAKANDVLTGFGLSKSLNGRLTNVPRQAETSAAVHEQVRGTIPLSELITSQQSLLTAKGPAGLMVTPGGIRGKNSFERIMERLSTSYPHFTRGSLTDFLKEVRLSNGGSLSGLSYDEIVNKVAQLIESKLSESSNSGQNKPSNQFAWCSSRQLNSWEGARAMTEEQDPCVICHEELAVESMLVLPCAHKFHSQCIESWLNEQRTCPTCRLHVVLPQEFPDLPSRKIPPLWTAQKRE